MGAKHTPGPWFVAAQNDGLVIIDGPPSPAPYDGPIPKAHGPSVIATPNWRLAEHEANARLIAAAPELLEALIHARELIDKLGLDFPEADQKFDGEWASYREEFDAAIAKATGGAA